MNQNFNNDQEIWLPVVGYEGLYEDSNMGRVKSLNYLHTGAERILKTGKDSKGYLQVKLCKDGIQKSHKVHRLVMTSFKPDLFADQYQINHRNCNKEDNRVKNLEYCTAQYNVDYSNSKPILQITLNGELVREWKSTREAGRNGFHQGNIVSCCRGEYGYKTHKGYIWKYKEADD